ncbi:patatin-like phospholipase family protein [Methylomonas sp. AM2-LC]|uniref:patatin-like phospholipase family protein n=1 Tax=Methylomonas sp. AM2-LC TaxID=3153301 RepID=UPI0032634921
MRTIVNFWFFLFVCLLSGCASYPPTSTVAAYNLSKGYRYKLINDTQNSDSLFVILTFSGGGTRAAALSYGVLEKLRNTPIVWEGRQTNLLNEVDIISSVSGGSFTAGYYAAFGDAIFKEKNEPGFLKDFLYRDIEGELVTKLFYPSNWFRLASPDYSRIDLAADLYDTEIFQRRSYADLAKQNKKPFLMINATDMTQGARFTFQQSQFDPMCDDLDAFPLARAVAASSNFPVAFPPMTLDNHAGTCNYKPPGWIAQAEHDLLNNLSRYKNAEVFKTYQDSNKRPYIHLLDGGIADNIGLRGPLQALITNDTEINLFQKVNNGAIKKLLVISVDAKNQPDLDYDLSQTPPSVIDVLSVVANVPMDNFSFETTQSLRNAFDTWSKEKISYSACQNQIQLHCPNAKLSTPAPSIPELDFIYIGFDLLANPAEHKEFEMIPTTFSLPASQIDALRGIAGRLLGESAVYQKYAESLSK